MMVANGSTPTSTHFASQWASTRQGVQNLGAFRHAKRVCHDATVEFDNNSKKLVAGRDTLVGAYKEPRHVAGLVLQAHLGFFGTISLGVNEGGKYLVGAPLLNFGHAASRA